MTNKPEHTALPWVSVEKYTDNGEYSHSDISDTDGFCIAQVITGDRAAFITRACNSHYDLIDALEQIEQQLDYGQHSTAHKIAIDALEKARGEA